MKRTKSIDLKQMRKKPRFTVTKLVAAMAGVALWVHYSDSKQEAIVYKSLADCNERNPGHATECKAAYEKAVEDAARTAPRYGSETDCTAEFTRCASYSDSNGQHLFMPLMAGFIVGKMTTRADEQQSSPIFSGSGSLSGSYYGADGTRYGTVGESSVKVSNSAFKSKPTATRTISRGGFGSIASAKSSWGSSSSWSGKSSWGG